MTAASKRYSGDVYAIVDGGSSAAQYLPIADQYGISMVQVHSSSERVVRPMKGIGQSTPYCLEVVYNSDSEGDIIAELQKRRVKGIFAGTETGVVVADRLSELMSLRTNGSEKSLCRRNKFAMHKRVSEFGLRVPDQILSNNVEEIISWHRKSKIEKIVLKPVDSAGSDSVAVLSQETGIRDHAHSILGKPNKLKLINTHVLAQEYIGGQEYAVNAVSFDGEIKFTHIWKYYKKVTDQGQFVYDYEDILKGDGETEQAIYAYVGSVLKALGIRFGASHTEIKIDDQGPVLIECAARADGICFVPFDREIIGESQIEMGFRSWLGETLEISPTNLHPYLLKKLGCNLSLISDQTGVVNSIPGSEFVSQLPSFVGFETRVGEKDFLDKTVDIFTSPGTVYLAHEDHVVLKQDIAKIRQFETSGKFWNLEL